MKLGRKKASADQAADAAESAPDRKNKPAKGGKRGDDKPSGPRRRSLAAVATSQALVVLLAAVVSLALVYVLVVQPAGRNAAQARANLELSAATQRLNQALDLMVRGVNGLAAQARVRDVLVNGDDPSPLAADLAGVLPGARAAYLFSRDRLPRSVGSESLLGFSGLELARRAATGQKVSPEAVPRDGTWYLQMAAPVQDPSTKVLQGSLVVVFDASVLNPLLSPIEGGQLALLQSASGTTRVVAGKGNNPGSALTRALSTPDWSVSYTPAPTTGASVSSVLLGLLVGVPGLLAAVLVWLLMSRAQSGLRQDVTGLTAWSHKAFGGERTRLPEFRWDMVASLGEVLSRLAQVVDKRVTKAAESARPKPGRSAPAAPASPEEPLFQDKDLPDIDMLDGDEDVLGFGGGADGFGGDDVPDVSETEAPPVSVAPEIFRAYDIRGIVGETLTVDVVRVIGQAIGSEAVARGVDTLCVGYDGRHSSPELADALARGLLATGCNVIDIGAVPTPVLYFATHELATGSGVMVTGSHNPSNYNGLKIMLGGETLSGDAIQKLYQRLQTADLVQGQGDRSAEDVRRRYLDRIVGDVAVAAPLKVVVDAGNGIAGELGPMLIEELGCDVTPLFCEVDGDFPNHHPDPGKPDNLAALIERVQRDGADLGIAFDGDGDRVGVVTNTGKIIWPDRLLMLFARDVVSRNPGADVIYDVKCSRRLATVITEAGGRPILWKTGHSFMKAKMKETGALLAGEMSGHIFFGERWYGFDDGLYAAARLLEILGIEDRHCDEVFEDFPEDISTPELNLAVTEASKFTIMERLAADGDFGEGNVSTIDGIRVDYPDGWGLCRASNTTPVLVLRFEAETDEALARIQDVFRQQLAKAAPNLNIDF
ncbi:phosphomannomutase/phosphoglucomutase [Marinobacter sp. C2H3]|uniref:phosphomannomutase/phosphoglucomutase n=1 Tax=Marinobacter sp. C2H3 TaxID=3119003 RepID=UPI00300F5D88